MYGLQTSKGPASLNGRMIVHDNRAELEFLFPTARIIRIDAKPEDTLPLRFHPDFEGVHFPIRKADFR